MTKQQLIDYLNNFLKENLTVDIYFIFKNGGFYIPYKVDPADDLRDEFIEEFSKELSRYSEVSNEYPLTDVYDDNEHEDYHLFYDNISNNEIAKEIFIFDHALVEPYSKSIGPLSKIHGFIIELYNGENIISIYKRNQPTNAINPDRVINFFTGSDDKFKLLDQNAIYMTKSIDLFKINDLLFINSRNVYELHFGFIAELQKKAESSYMELLSDNGFDFSEKLLKGLPPLSKNELKKITVSVRGNPILLSKNYKAIVKQAKRYERHKFEVDEEGIIKISTKKEFQILVRILNRDYNVNEATKELFLTKNKKLLK
jgi:hypothetical protein